MESEKHMGLLLSAALLWKAYISYVRIGLFVVIVTEICMRGMHLAGPFIEA